MDAVFAHDLELTGYALDRLGSRFGDKLRIFGPADLVERGGVISLSMEGVHPHDLAQVLDRFGVCVRPGHHCAKPLMRKLGVPATARVSFGPYSLERDVDALLDGLDHAARDVRLTMDDLEDLYREIILDHYRSPRNRGELDSPPAHRAEGFNPLCGDEIVLTVLVEDGTRHRRQVRRATAARSRSPPPRSCRPRSRASPSSEARGVLRSFKRMMTVEEPDEPDDEPVDLRKMGELAALQGVVKFPVRIKCATLAWNTLDQALADVGA